MNRVTTTEQFITKAHAIHQNKGYDYSKTLWAGREKKIIFDCKIHGEISQVARQHLDTGCPFCNQTLYGGRYTTETWIEKAKSIHDPLRHDKELQPLDYSNVKYVNAHKKVDIVCNIHGVFSQIPNAHISQKQGCPACGLENKSHPGTKTNETFVSQAKIQWNDLYDYSETNYINKTTKLKYFCNKCQKEIEQYPTLHIKSGCPYCAGRGIGKYTQETFLAKVKGVHEARGDFYNYSKTVFGGVHEKIIVICEKLSSNGEIHGEFIQAASNHINGAGCSKCHGGVKYSHQDFVELAKNRFAYESTYTKAHALL